MHWENDPPSFTDLPGSEIPSELLSGLERYAAESRLLKLRLRWRPDESTSRGYLTKDRLVGIEAATIQEIAVALVSYARHLYEQGDCEERFEVQVRRELDDPDEPDHPIREWRSITFHVDPLPSQRAMQMEPQDDDEQDDDARDDDDALDDDDAFDETDDLDDESDDEPSEPRDQTRWSRPPGKVTRSTQPQARPPRVVPRHRPATPSPRDRADRQPFAQYADESHLYRIDPMVYAMTVVRQTYDRVLDTFEHTLATSFDRLDRTLDSQNSHSDFINDAMRTVTQGAGEIAGVGIDLFRAGLEHQAGAARLSHDSETDKDRNEFMRDAVQQGSLLAQAVIMSNTAKRRASTERQPTDAPEPRTDHGAAPRTSQPSQRPQPPHTAEGDLRSRIRSVVDGITAEQMDALRTHAPSIAGILEQLRANPSLDLATIRQIVMDGSKSLDIGEMLALRAYLPSEFQAQVLDLINKLAQGAKQP